jgi:type I restriction enzyme M protein
MTIENLTDEEAKYLLSEKWIVPLYKSILELPNEIINELTSNVKRLQDKYQTTLSQVDDEIKLNEKALIASIDELEGDEFDMKGLSELKSLLKGE